MSLKRNLIDKVFDGRANFMNLLVYTATGTGLGTATYRVGQMCLDSSSSNWFLCTATTGTGTWVGINA